MQILMAFVVVTACILGGFVLAAVVIAMPIFKQPGRCLTWSQEKGLHYSNILIQKNAGLRDVDGNPVKPGQTLLVTKEGGLLVIVNVASNAQRIDCF